MASCPQSVDASLEGWWLSHRTREENMLADKLAGWARAHCANAYTLHVMHTRLWSAWQSSDEGSWQLTTDGSVAARTETPSGPAGCCAVLWFWAPGWVPVATVVSSLTDATPLASECQALGLALRMVQSSFPFSCAQSKAFHLLAELEASALHNDNNTGRWLDTAPPLASAQEWEVAPWIVNAAFGQAVNRHIAGMMSGILPSVSHAAMQASRPQPLAPLEIEAILVEMPRASGEANH